MINNNFCCGYPMSSFGDVNHMLDMNIETSEMKVCLECGNFTSLVSGQLDIEDVLNDVNSFGSDTDKKRFVELHPEFNDEVV